MDDSLDKSYRLMKHDVLIIITKLDLTIYTNKRMSFF